jgi:hypothetical protein
MMNTQPNGCFSTFMHYFMVVLWRLVPIFLAVIMGISLSAWAEPSSGNCEKNPEDCIRYPPWIHSIGIALILVVVAQIPIWAVVTSLYYLCAPSKSIRDVVRPTKEWGPGNKEAFKMYQRHKANTDRQKGHPHGYENPSMAGYPYYNYAGAAYSPYGAQPTYGHPAYGYHGHM